MPFPQIESDTQMPQVSQH